MTTIDLIRSAAATLQWARVHRDMFIRSLTQRLFPRSVFEPCRLPAPAPVPVRRTRPHWRVIAPALAAAITFALSASSAHAWRRTGMDDAVRGQLVEVQVQVEGESAPLFLKSGDWDRRYFQAFRGRHYSLAVRNLTGRRIGVLISVDGLNVVNGERTSASSGEDMYVLDPWQSATIRGWRSSLDDVRRFVFVDEDHSYASRTDQANGDMGWIRVHAFREFQPVSWWRGGVKNSYRDDGREQQVPPLGSSDERERRNAPESKAQGDATSPAPATEGMSRNMTDRVAPQAESFPGTGWGDRKYDPVRRVEFRAESNATDQLVLRYEYESGLHALGIFPRQSRLGEREDGQLGFARPPHW